MPIEAPLGRQLELSRVDSFLDALPTGVAALTVTGPAGIGKTTVWREGVRRGAERGNLMLIARPTQAEARLSFAGLADLLRPIGEEAFHALPAVQRRALDVALLRTEAGSSRIDARAVSTALLSLLQQLAGGRCLLLAVDDAHWLDAATSETLSFALRRLEGFPVGVLVSVRVEGDRDATFECAVPAERRHEVSLGPLSTAAVHEILKRELGHPRVSLGSPGKERWGPSVPSRGVAITSPSGA